MIHALNDVHFRPIPPRKPWLGPRFFCDRRAVFSGEWSVEARKVTCQRCLRVLADIGAQSVLNVYPCKDAGEVSA